MEDLLWKYPDEVFPRQGFKPVARQFTLSGAGRLDISFRDANDRLWVIEVKAVPVRTETADQVHRYAQKLRDEHPLDPPIPAVVAPLINATVRDHFDRWGIEHFEITEATFRRVANERGIAMEQPPRTDPPPDAGAKSTDRKKPQYLQSGKSDLCDGLNSTECRSYAATGRCIGGWVYNRLPPGYSGPFGGEKADGTQWGIGTGRSWNTTHYMLPGGHVACGGGGPCTIPDCCGSKGWVDALPLHTAAKLHTSLQPRSDDREHRCKKCTKAGAPWPT